MSVDFFASHEQLFIQTFDFAILAASLQVVLRSGVFSLASIGFFSLGAYGAGIAAKAGWPLPAVLAGVVLGGLLGGYAFARPLRRLRGLYLGMATMAFSLVIPVLATSAGSLAGGAVGLYGIPVLASVWHLLGAALVVGFILSRLERGWAGRAQMSLRLDENLARSVGIGVAAQRDLLFAVSASLGAVAGALNALTSSIVTPSGSAGFVIVTLGLTMAIVGGRSSWAGAYLGAVLLSWLPEWIRWIGIWQTAAYGLMLALMMIAAPDGMLGLGQRGARALRARGRAEPSPSRV